MLFRTQKVNTSRLYNTILYKKKNNNERGTRKENRKFVKFTFILFRCEMRTIVFWNN